MQNLFKWISALLFLILIILSSILFYLNQPISSEYKEIDFEIKKGELPKNIIDNLVKKDIIRNYSMAYAFLKLNLFLKKNLFFGYYKLSKSFSTIEIINLFFSQKNLSAKQISLQIPPGYNIYEIADLVYKKNFIKEKEEFIEFINSKEVLDEFNQNYGLKVKSLEGFFYPSTYFFHEKDSLNSIIQKIIKEFWKKFPLYDFVISKNDLNLDFYQILILASLIQKESYIPEEKPIISSVFHNRLKQNMRLECDPTVIYALIKKDIYHKGTLSRKNGDLNIDSPYNTYLYPGLPPTPISNPDISSIVSAIYPEKTDYLFFVANELNQHSFSKTFNDHKIHVEKFKNFKKKQ